MSYSSFENFEDNFTLNTEKIYYKPSLRLDRINNVNEYARLIEYIKNDFIKTEDSKIMNLKFFDDTSISIGLCGNYIPSISLKLKCPFDKRTKEKQFDNEISIELNIKKVELEQIDKKINVFNTEPRCKRYCTIIDWCNKNDIKIKNEQTQINIKLYNEIIAPTLKNFIIKI